MYLSLQCFIVLLQSNLDVDSAWRNGVPLVSSAPMCIRTVCFLCGSAGKEEVGQLVLSTSLVV